MAGISVIILVLLMCMILILFMGIAVAGVAMFIAAIALTIAFLATKNDRKAKGKDLGWKVSIPAVLFAISIPIITVMVLIFGMIFVGMCEDYYNSKYIDNIYNERYTDDLYDGMYFLEETL